MEISFHALDSQHNEGLEYAVIVARYHDKWVFVQHKDRDTWEIPGGKRELQEHIYDTAKRELHEETGANSYNIVPVCVYSVERSPEDKSYGMLFFAEIHEMGRLPESEIRVVSGFNSAPSPLTYPEIQPFLFAKVNEELYTITQV